MGIIETALSIYFILLLIRTVIPDTGQLTFNHPYRVVVKLTGPVVNNLAKLLPRRGWIWAPITGMLLLIILQGAFYAGATTVQARIFKCGISHWTFYSNQAFWGVGKSFMSHLVLIYRFYLLLLFISLVSPLSSSSDQVSRLIKGLIRPLERSGPVRAIAPVMVVVGFYLILTVIWKIYQAIGWLGAEEMVPLKAGVDSIALLVPLISFISLLILARAVISWFDSSGRYTSAFSWLKLFSDPFLLPFRRLNLIVGSFDLTPLVAILALNIIGYLSGRILGAIYPQ
jgi:YggT family protein